MHFWLCLNKYFVSTISSDYFWISNIAVLWPKLLIFLDIQLFFCMDSQVKVRQLWFSSSWEIHHLQMMRSLVWSTQSSQILSQKSSFYRDQMLITITKQIMNSNLSSLYIIIEAWSRLIFIWHNNKLKNCYRIVGGDHWSQHNKDPPSQDGVWGIKVSWWASATVRGGLSGFGTSWLRLLERLVMMQSLPTQIHQGDPTQTWKEVCHFWFWQFLIGIWNEGLHRPDKWDKWDLWWTRQKTKALWKH